MEQPGFIKEFSKQKSPEDRHQLAQEILEKRKDYFGKKEEIETKEQEKNELVKELEVLQHRIESYNSASFFVKIKDFLAIKKIKAEMRSKSEKRISAEEDLSTSIEERPDLDETRRMLSGFYSREKKNWSEAPYSKEDIAKYFTEEHLASLSLDDYALLLQRFPGQMVCHITRQGVRDHYGMFEHMKGLGKGQNSFKKMLESKRLRSPLGVALSQALSYHDICKFLNGGEELVTNRDAIERKTEPVRDLRLLVKNLKHYTDNGSNKNFDDKDAIHFAVEKVLNGIYGGESGNEIFIAYPSACIASQYYFKNWGNDVLSQPDASNDNHNDLYVWAKNEADGMNLDAGIVFIPENVSVDVESGSQYEFDALGNPVETDGVLKKSERTMPSKGYWENYFSRNSNSRPSKIVYYDASLTPSEALWDWKTKNNIINKKDSATLGFDENAINTGFERPGGDKALVQFHQLALAALEHEYGSADLIHAYDKDFFARPKDEWQDSINKIYKKTGTDG